MNEMPEVYCHDQPVARKDHKCCECSGKILKGEKYHNHHGIWDGTPATWKVCADCEIFKKEIDKGIQYSDEYVPFEGLFEYVLESRDMEWLSRFVAIRRRRSGPPFDGWVLEKLSEPKLAPA